MVMATATVMGRPPQPPRPLPDIAAVRVPVTPLRLAVTASLTLVLAGLAGANALEALVAPANPALALSVRPGSARAMTRDAEFSLAKALSDKREYAVAERKALRAVAASPANPRALQVLGLAAQQRNDTAAAGRYMTLSSQLSRRNGLVQIWLVDQAARAGRSAEALAHFDITMRASPAFSAQLYPILANALQSREIRDAFRPYIKGNPSWLAPFLGFAADQSPNPADVSKAIVEAGGMPQGKEFRGTTALLLDKLSATGKFADMARFYRSARRGADTGAMTSLSVDRAGTDPDFTPMTWKPVDSGDVQVSPVAAEQKGRFGLRFEAFDTRGAEAARKYLFLEPGAYRIAHRAVALGEGGGRLQLALACPGANGLLARLDLRAGEGTKRIVVPAGCTTQLAVLAVTDATGDDGLDLALTLLDIAPG